MQEVNHYFANDMKKGYTKYKTIYLPQPIVEAIIINHKFSEEQDKIYLDICFDMVNNIIEKSSFIKNYNKYLDLYAPMSSLYLKKRYNDKYKTHKDFLFLNNIIYVDNSFKGKATYFYLQSIKTYNKLIENRIDILKEDKNFNEELYISYCFRFNIQLDVLDTIKYGDLLNRKNRIYCSWYKIRVPITNKNKSFFVKDYEEDSKFINNAPKHIKKMGSHFRKHFVLDTDKALYHIETQYLNESENASNSEEKQKADNRYFSRICSIRAIENGRNNKSLRFNRNSTNNRLDTNLTNMASDLKPFIVGWENMVYLDLKNSQPVLFNTILKGYFENGTEELKNEIKKYREATLRGKWYETLQDVYNQDRESSKDIWMMIAYSKNASYKDLKSPFKNEFPNIYKIISNIKKTNHKDFAINLQKLESKVFIDTICRKLVEENIIPFSVHDALIVKKEEVRRTKEIMEEVLFEYLGGIPKISKE